MDLGLIVNIAVAIGTLAMAVATVALAYFTFKNIKNSDKQLKFLKQQISLLLSQQQPDLQITKCSFDGNKLILILKNSGDGVAQDIVVSTAFHIVNPLFVRSSIMGLRESIIIPEISEQRNPEDIDGIKKGRNLFFNILLTPKNKNNLESKELVIFPINDEFSNSLPTGYENKIFQCETLFQLKIKIGLFDGIFQDIVYLARAIQFNELKRLLLNNNIKEISVIFHLLSKDKLQNVISHGTICNFIINLANDESLEIAYKKGVRGPYPLDKDEIKSRLAWLDYDTYRYGKYMLFDDDE